MNSTVKPHSVTIQLEKIEADGKKFRVTVKPYREDAVSLLVTASQFRSGEQFAGQLLAQASIVDSYLLTCRPREWVQEIDRLMANGPAK